MEHPYAYRTHYREDGEVCHCPWGRAPGGEHLGSIREASKLEWLEGRPDMQNDVRNQYFLNYLRGDNGEPPARNGIGYTRVPDHDQQLERADKMLPWIHREFKKGRLLPASDGGPGGPSFNYMPQGESWNDDHVVAIDPEEKGKKPWFVKNRYVGNRLSLHELADWQEHLEEMKKRGQGLDLMQHKVHELAPKIRDFEDWKKTQEREDAGEILHKFDNGWTMRRLQNAAEHADEGEEMGHCIGGGGYCDETERGEGNLYASLRDEKNLPHASIQISPDHWVHKETGEKSSEYPGRPSEGWVPRVGPSSNPGEFYGKQDREPEPEYADMVNDWLGANNAPYAHGGRGEAEYVTVGPATDVTDYLGIHGEDGPYEYAPEEDGEGRPVGEHTEYQIEPPNLDHIAVNLLEGPKPYQSTLNYTGPWDWDDVQNVFHTARQNHHLQSLTEALHANADPEYDDDHHNFLTKWDAMLQPYYHPYTGELSEGWQQGKPIDEFQKPLFEQSPNWKVPGWYGPTHQRLGPETRRWNYPEYNGPLYEENPLAPNGREPYGMTYSHAGKPLYYRWVFSPTKGVTLGTNQDAHPALIDYHQNLGGQINDTDLTHGYAYPIGNGYRVTDYEHQPVSDPYIVNAVVRRLNLGRDPQMSAEGSWQPTEYDFDRLHYGLPKEKTGIF